MSPLVVLGALGTLVSTITIVPHVAHAMRTRKPGGSPLAWVLGVTGSTIWLVYGIASGDLLVAAPGLVTVPCGLLLAIWSLRSGRGGPAGPPAAPVALEVGLAAEPVFVPDAWLAEGYAAPADTVEMPAVA